MPSRGRAGRPPPARSGVVHQRSHRLAERVRGDARVPDPGEEVPQVRLGVARVTELPGRWGEHRLPPVRRPILAAAGHSRAPARQLDRPPTRLALRLRFDDQADTTNADNRSPDFHRLRIQVQRWPRDGGCLPDPETGRPDVRSRNGHRTCSGAAAAGGAGEGEPRPQPATGTGRDLQLPRDGPSPVALLPHRARRTVRGRVRERRTKWGRFAPGSESRSTGLSVGQTTALMHPWGSAASGSWRGTALATPTTGCPEPAWFSGSRRRPPTSSARRAKRPGRWCSGEGPSTSPMGGVANTLWMCRFLLLAAQLHQRGSPKDRRSGSSPTDWKVLWSKPKRWPATRTSASAPPASCSSASERDSWTRSTSTWCPSCSGAASACSTTSAPGRSTWSARV